MHFLNLFFCLLVTSTLFAQNTGNKVVQNNPFTSINGQEQTLTEIIKAHKGKVIYVDFWASWCMPCRQEMKASKQLHHALKGEEVVFVYISIDKNVNQWKRSMKQLEITELGVHYQRNQGQMMDFLRFFNISSIPHYLLISPKGEFIDSNATPPSNPHTKKQIKRLLAGKS